MDDKPIEQGWQCPVCKTVLAPSVKTCKKCTANEQKVTSDVKLLTEWR